MKNNKMKWLYTVMLVGLVAFGTACTENARAKRFGGTMKVDIPPTEKFLNATWKDSELWYLTTQRSESDSEKNVYIFQEDSSLGILEGKVIFTEK